MSYYPGWFDYAGWIAAGAGVVCGWKMAAESVGRRRGLFKLGMCAFLALGITFAASEGIIFNLRAPRLTAQGQVFEVVRHTGRGSSTTFCLRIPSGEIDNLHLSSAIEEIANGETAKVGYQTDSYAVLDIDILEGPHAGYQTSSSNGLGGAVFALVGAAVLAVYGVINWFTDGTGEHSEATDDRSAPDGDVDTKSMLDLSSRE